MSMDGVRHQMPASAGWVAGERGEASSQAASDETPSPGHETTNAGQDLLTQVLATATRVDTREDKQRCGRRGRHGHCRDWPLSGDRVTQYQKPIDGRHGIEILNDVGTASHGMPMTAMFMSAVRRLANGLCSCSRASTTDCA